MKKLLILVIASLAVCCKKHIEQPLTSNTQEKSVPIYIVNSLSTLPKSTMDFTITKVEVADKKIRLFINSGGCDEIPNFTLNKIAQNNNQCTAEEIYIVYQVKNACKRMNYFKIDFNLADLKLCANKLILKGGTTDIEVELE